MSHIRVLWSLSILLCGDAFFSPYFPSSPWRVGSVAHAEEASSPSTQNATSPEAPRARSEAFYPVWRLLTQEQKLQFVAGYVHGWRDASRVLDIAIGYVQENPERAVDGMRKLSSLYNLSDIAPSIVVTQIDRFFSQPDNREASLSYALSAARSPEVP